MIQLFKPSITTAEEEAVLRVLRSGWLGTGPEVAAFEREFAAYCGVPAECCIATNSCSSALAIACRMVGPSVTARVPALTFVATPEAMCENAYAWPIAVDVAPDTLCATELCGIHVHYAGYPSYSDAPIHDCAHAMGAMRDGRQVGMDARFACFSFHAVKNLACGDGGMLVCKDRADAAQARRMAWHGISRDTHQRTERQAYSWEYDVPQPGMKGRMNDLAAALGREQLKRLPEMAERRRVLAKRYTEKLRGVEKPAAPTGKEVHAWHLYVIRHDDRDALRAHLEKRGIATGVHYRPWTEYAPYRQDTPPVVAREWRRLVSLPMYPDMGRGEQDMVIRAVNDFATGGG